MEMHLRRAGAAALEGSLHPGASASEAAPAAAPASSSRRVNGGGPWHSRRPVGLGGRTRFEATRHPSQTVGWRDGGRYSVPSHVFGAPMRERSSQHRLGATVERMLGRRRAVFACCFSVAALAAGAGTAHAAPGMEVAVQDDGLFLGDASSYSRDRGFQRLRELKASRLRINVIWSRVLRGEQADRRNAPRRPLYDWARFDRAVEEAADNGVKVHLTLTGEAPAWATGFRSHRRGR